MIELKNISKRYTHSPQQPAVLDHINLSIDAGELVGIIGKSGAGKSTLLRCVNLLERPSGGEVWVKQQNLTALTNKALRQARRKIGFIFQHFNLLSSRTARQNIALPLELQHVPASKIQQRVDELLSLTDLTRCADHYPSQLSGGQKQRVAIARALANHPHLLLCDEITSALDAETTLVILKLIKKIQQQLNIAILFISHDINVIKSIADRVVVLDRGGIAEDSNIVQLFKQPKSHIAKTLAHAALHCDLPNELQQQLKPIPSAGNEGVISITFAGQSAIEPIIHNLIRDKNLIVNIIKANLEYIQGETIGVMLISIKANEHEVLAAIDFLQHKNCQAQLLGYIDELNN
jgi:D-methionine transport system ATP-binding protein